VKIVLDTNVLLSGVFFHGNPQRILGAWQSGSFALLISPEIFTEYQRVASELSKRYPKVDAAPVLEFLAAHSIVVNAPPLPTQVCEDPDDDMFLSCARAGKADFLVTGDKLLLKVKNFHGIPIITPKQFVDVSLK
jgi:uncharacterized protein